MRWEQRDWGEEKGKLLCRDTIYERIVIIKKEIWQQRQSVSQGGPSMHKRVTRKGRAQSGAGRMQEM